MSAPRAREFLRGLALYKSYYFLFSILFKTYVTLFEDGWARQEIERAGKAEFLEVHEALKLFSDLRQP